MIPDRVVVTQRPMGRQERLRAALRHTDQDLFERGGRTLLVTALDDEGQRVLLGEVDLLAALQIGAPALRELIGHVLFAPHRRPS